MPMPHRSEEQCPVKISGTEYKIGKKLKNVLTGAFAALVWLAVWQIVYLKVDREVLVASPLNVFMRLCELLATSEFWIKTGNSLLGISAGYFSAVILGTLLAVVTSSFKILYAVFKPLLNIIRATPVVSFIILALVWMAKKEVPVFISFLMVLPIVWANVSTGISETDRDLLEMAKVYKMPKKYILTKIYIPSVMPMFLNAVTTGLGFAWKSGIAAEVLSTPKDSIGIELYNSKVYLETVDLFAWTVVVIALSMILEKLFVYIINRLVVYFGGK